MRKIALKLAACIVAMPLSVLLMVLTQNGYFSLLFLLSLPFAILYWVDLGRELRDAKNPGALIRILGIFMGVPQALFGLVCIGVGLAIAIWVLYNTFVERQPEYTGGFLTFGIGPTLVLFGAGWLFTAFHRGSSSTDGA